MKRDVGLWIDHRKAVIVTVSDEGDETKVIESGMEKHVRFAGGSDVDELGRRHAGPAIREPSGPLL